MDFYALISRLLLLAMLLAVAMFIICSPLALPPPAADLPDDALLPALAAPDGLERDRVDSPFANVEVVVAGGLSLEQAYLLVNGVAVGDFSRGSLQARVYDGDLLAVDCRAYGRELSFYTHAVSASLDASYLAAELSCCGEVASLGFAVIRRL